jgi:HprK-related kinase A
LIVSDLTPARLQAALIGPGLVLRTGPLTTRIRSPLGSVHEAVRLHYGAHPVLADEAFADFHVRVDRPMGARRWYKPQAIFSFDGGFPFTPLPLSQAFPLLEWGLNWCVYSHCDQFLTLHSAVLERGGHALLMPAHSGSGKSTLCAALAFRGWRLMSDELALVLPSGREVQALPRPISLKNQSIDIIRQFAADAVFGPVVRDTLKGSVCHVRPPAGAVEQADVPASPRWVVFPKYVAGAPAELRPLSRAQGFMKMLGQTFNSDNHGREGFATLANLVEQVDCYEFSYGRLDEAIAIFDRLAINSPLQAVSSRVRGV